MKPTYEELEARLQRTEELLKIALEEIAKLKEQLKRNSKNSSKPPSTDQKVNTPDGKKSLQKVQERARRDLFFLPIKSIDTWNAGEKTVLIVVHQKYS